MKTSKKSAVLFNGDLVVRDTPVAKAAQSIGQYLVYRIVDEQAWFWCISATKPEAVTISHGVAGRLIQIRTVEF